MEGPNPIRRYSMKIAKIEELTGKIPKDHYDLINRSLYESKSTKIAFTRMKKTGRCDPHIHANAEQLFIVLKGAMMFKSVEDETLVKEGHTVLFEVGEVHSNYNAVDEGTEYLTVTTFLP
jgi:quercetin dioxygenase-like cupin family protein